jgi:hypothetical protein
MASGHVNRVKRPNTWLHRPMLQNVKKALANPEPSTHDPYRKSRLLTNGRCHVAKYWGRKTFIALNRYAVERGSRRYSTSTIM